MVMGLFEAYDRGGETVVVVDAQGNLVEGPDFNVFTVKDRLITTPGRGVLEGITRKTVIELATEGDCNLVQRHLLADEARAADASFGTSTAGGILPITKINGQIIGSGSLGPVTRELQKGYWALHDDPQYTIHIDYD